MEDVLEALAACRDALAGAPPARPRTRALAEWRAMAVLPAVAAIDMALWDLEGGAPASPCGGCSARVRPGRSMWTTDDRRARSRRRRG